MEFDRNEAYFDDLFQRLAKSSFRSRFHLKSKEIAWLNEKGMDVCKEHAFHFIRERLAPAYPRQDGKQTPMKSHPVFIAQHATGCCCRGCLEKWHGIPKGVELNSFEQQYIAEVLMCWIRRELSKASDIGIDSHQRL